MDQRDQNIEEQQPLQENQDKEDRTSEGKNIQLQDNQEQLELKQDIQPEIQQSNLEIKIEAIQQAQQKYIFMLFIQFSLVMIGIGVFYFYEFQSLFSTLPFMVWFVLLLGYILCLAATRFSQKELKKHPRRIILLIVSTILRLFWILYVVFMVNELRIDYIVGVIWFNFIVIFICYRIDRWYKINNCFLIKSQSWRLTFIILIELLLVGYWLNIEDIRQASICACTITFTYLYCLLSIQMVEFRPFLQKKGNIWCFSITLFDGDIIFPCYFFEHHCSCCRGYSHTILIDKEPTDDGKSSI